MGMGMKDGKDQASTLYPLTESPAAASGGSPSPPGKSHSAGSRSPGTDRRSPLGRKVVTTALEAELDEVRSQGGACETDNQRGESG